MRREPDGAYVYEEKSEYYFVSKKRQVSQRYLVRVRLADGKLGYLHQYQKVK